MGRFAREYQGPPPQLLPPAEKIVLDARAARRTLRFFAVAVFVLVVGAAFAFTVTRERRGDSRGSSSASGPATTSVASGAAADVSIGPPAGSDVGPYLDARQQALAAATGDRVAVVSFESYVAEADARAKVGALPVDALLVAVPGGHPSVVTNGLEAWSKTQRQADESERDEIRKLLPTVTDPAFKSFYESEIVRLEAAIAGVSPTGPVVYGVVVRAPADALRTLSATGGIRLVDVGQAATSAPGATYRAVRPEETVKVGQPATRPV